MTTEALHEHQWERCETCDDGNLVCQGHPVPFPHKDMERADNRSEPSRLREDVGNLLNTPCDCGESWTGRGRHNPDCRWRFIHDFLDDDEIAIVLATLTTDTDDR